MTRDMQMLRQLVVLKLNDNVPFGKMVGEMAERTSTSKCDVNRAEILNAVVEEEVTLKCAAKRLQLSYQQAMRSLKRYREEGAAGIVHRNVGRPSHRRKDEQTRQRFGELLQFDGSHHDWFEQRGERCCVMNMVDDATGTTFARMSEEETTEAAMWLLRGWIERYGIPEEVYCDRKNSFLIDREPTIEEQLSGTRALSPFELACERLGIEVIPAGSPQAKGRVERSHGVYQDRFVKELRLANISSIEQANQFLADTYLPSINSKFAIEPVNPEDAHVPLLPHQPLEDIFCFEEQRVVSRDYVIRYHNRLFQLTPTKGVRLPKPNTRVTVRRRLDKTVYILSNDTRLAYEDITPTRKEERSQRSA